MRASVLFVLRIHRRRWVSVELSLGQDFPVPCLPHKGHQRNKEDVPVGQYHLEAFEGCWSYRVHLPGHS